MVLESLAVFWDFGLLAFRALEPEQFRVLGVYVEVCFSWRRRGCSFFWLGVGGFGAFGCGA